MCGIVGYFVFPEPRNECKTITEMSREIYHRGPDDEGFAFIAPPSKQFLELASRDTHEVVREWQGVIEPKTFDFPHQVAMAHRRFSIIDLSHTGHQPMPPMTQEQNKQTNQTTMRNQDRFHSHQSILKNASYLQTKRTLLISLTKRLISPTTSSQTRKC